MHAGFSGFRAFVARKKGRCKLIGNRFVIPHDTIPSNVRHYKKMKRILFITSGLILVSILAYTFNPRVKFYTHFGIGLPSFCKNFEFTDNPDFMALLGMDGHGASAKFEIDKTQIENLIEAIQPQDLWLKYSELDSNLTDTTLHYPAELPQDVLDGQIKVMLWSDDTKGDYYNIWLIPSDNGKINVSISMPFT